MVLSSAALALALRIAAKEWVERDETPVQGGSSTGWEATELASKKALLPGEHEGSWQKQEQNLRCAGKGQVGTSCGTTR